MSRVSYLSGDTISRDHIYWPRITAAQLADLGGVARSISCDLDTIMALSWRIRRFVISGSCSVSVNYHSNNEVPPYQDVYVTMNWEIPGDVYSPMIINYPGVLDPVTETQAAQSESDILGSADNAVDGGWFLHNYGFLGRAFNNVDFSGTVYAEVINPPSPPDPITDVTYTDQLSADRATRFAIFGANNPSDMGVVYDEDSGLFLPFISLVAQMNAGVGLGSNMSGSTDPDGTDGTFTIDPVIAPSISYPMRAGAITGNDSLVISLTGAFDIVATAVRFWPHENSNGDPVYDTLTGAQLRDPFS